MWFLIIPPIIIVVSLGLLVWYLSRKGTDPAVIEKLAEPEAPKKVSFLHTKNFFLRLLEKWTQRFKTNSLKMHNTIGDWSQSIKKKREQVGELAALQKSA